MFEREVAYLLNRWLCAVRLRDLTSVVLEAAEKAEKEASVDCRSSDDGKDGESKKIEKESQDDLLCK